MLTKLTLAAAVVAVGAFLTPASAAPLAPQSTLGAAATTDSGLVTQVHYRYRHYRYRHYRYRHWRHRHWRHRHWRHYRHCRLVCRGHLHWRHGHRVCHGHWHRRCY